MAFDSKGTLNKVMLIGRLGSDPELKYTPSGDAVATLSVATNTSWKSKDGSANENTEWHRVVVWRKLAEMLEQYAKKGTRVYVEGRLVTRSWEDKDGNKRYSTEIQSSTIQMLGSKQEGDSSGQSSNNEPPLPAEPEFDSSNSDDLPF